MSARPASFALALVLPLLLLSPGSGAAYAQAQSTRDPPKSGYWWYAPQPKVDKPDAPDPDALVKPVIPPMAELASWTPPKIRKLIEQQRDYAATVLTVCHHNVVTPARQVARGCTTRAITGRSRQSFSIRKPAMRSEGITMVSPFVACARAPAVASGALHRAALECTRFCRESRWSRSSARTHAFFASMDLLI